MKTLRNIYFILAFSLISAAGMSQGLLNSGSARGAGMLSGQLPDNTRFGIEIGTGFSSFSSGASMLGSYVSPHLEYDINPSLTIIAGGSFSFNRFNNLPGQSVVINSQSLPVNHGMTDHSLYLSGRYAINENLSMTGTVYREEGQFPLPFVNNQATLNRNSMNPGEMNYRSHGMSMGFQYRISDNFHFGAEVGVNRSNSPYYNHSPYSDPFRTRYNRSRHLFPY
jgi:hypothetical protein